MKHTTELQTFTESVTSLQTTVRQAAKTDGLAPDPIDDESNFKKVEDANGVGGIAGAFLKARRTSKHVRDGGSGQLSQEKEEQLRATQVKIQWQNAAHKTITKVRYTFVSEYSMTSISLYTAFTALMQFILLA